MIAIVEIDPSTRAVQSVKFSTDVAEVKSSNVHVVNILEPTGSPTEGLLNSLAMLVNNPYDLRLSNYPQGASNNNGSGLGEYSDGIIQVPDTYRSEDYSPYARNLSAQEKEELTVRPAAERAGQTSFFGNV